MSSDLKLHHLQFGFVVCGGDGAVADGETKVCAAVKQPPADDEFVHGYSNELKAAWRCKKETPKKKEWSVDITIPPGSSDADKEFGLPSEAFWYCLASLLNRLGPNPVRTKIDPMSFPKRPRPIQDRS